MNKTAFDAVVIGAGPSGATAARLLARAGWSVALVEKQSFPRRKVCGEFISATSLPLLHDRDIRDIFAVQAGPQVRRVGMFAGDSILVSSMPSASGTDGWGRALGREHLDLLLADAAVRAGACRYQPFKAVALRHDGQSYVCSVTAQDDSKDLTTRIVILAKGSWEKNTLIPEPVRDAKPSDLLAFKAHFTNSALADDLMPLLVFPGGYGGMVHSDGGRVSLSCCIRRDVLQRARAGKSGLSAGEAVHEHILKHCKGVRDALGPAQREGQWLSAGPIRPGIRRCAADGIFFVGNMAGEAHPIIAEGISMAMQSAWLLCRYLLASQDQLSDQSTLGDIGRSYGRDWRTAFATRIRAAAAFAHLAMQAKAALAAPLIRQFPGLLTWGAQLSGKTKDVIGDFPGARDDSYP